MDLPTLNEVAGRKRMKSDVQNLKEKISREKDKIIKLKVGQDTAYWELKEKLSAKERDHETLQRNMVQLQMEHEAVSAQYQDELRRRPETLNKLTSTREICDVLEENLSRVRASLQRSAADRAALADAYERAGAAVAAAHADNEKRLLAVTNEARSARELVRLSGEHGAQLMECASRERERATQAAADGERLREERNTIAERLARLDTLLQEREKTIHELRNELRRVAADFNERNEQSKSLIVDLEREAGAAASLRAALAQAEARGEAAAREGSRLAAELAAARAASDDATQRGAALTHQAQAAQSHIDRMKEALDLLVQKSEDLAKQLTDKNEKISSLEKVVADSKQEALKLAERVAIAAEERERERRDYEEREAEREREIHNYEQRIATTQRELINNAETIEKLTRDIAEMKEARAQAEATIAEQITLIEKERGDNEKREKQMAEYADTIARLKEEKAVEEKAHAQTDAVLANLSAERDRERRDFEERAMDAQRELIERNDTIAQLKRDLAEETEARVRAEAALAEREREYHGFEERAATAELKLTERNDTIANLRRDLAVESEARNRAVTALDSTRAELDKSREEAARFLDDVRHLKADSRHKDDEAAKQMKIILSLRSEKERMEEKINEMQNTITNIQEITRKTPPAGAGAATHREPPEHDDNAVAAPPAPFRPHPQPVSAAPRALTPASAHPRVQKPEPRNTDFFNLFSDSSSVDFDNWDNALDPVEVNRRFDELARGTPMSPVPLRALKRRHGATSRKLVKQTEPSSTPAPSSSPAPTSGPAPTQQPHVARKFFKTRRADRNERNKK